MTEKETVPHAWRPERFMVIAAHPDDADFGPAATAAAWIDQGSTGWLVCCTSGDAGGEDPDMDPLELAALREKEQRAAAKVVGYAGVSFLHMPDGALVNDLILREHLVREIRTFKPDAVLATDPENAFPRDGGVNHTDHRAAGWAAADAVYPAARNPMAFPTLARGGLAKHVVRRLYFFWTHRANAYVDISGTVYAPQGAVTMGGGSGGSGGTSNLTVQFICWDFTISGNSTFHFFYSDAEFARPKDYGLVK